MPSGCHMSQYFTETQAEANPMEALMKVMNLTCYNKLIIFSICRT